MIVITTHLNADFDCLASMAAAKKLHPSARMVFSGSAEKNVRDFIEQAGVPLEIGRLRDIDPAAVTTLVVVDTTNIERIGPFAEVSRRAGVTTLFYDHHPAPAEGLPGDAVIRPRGACATVMTELLREKDLPVSAEEATLLMLGIYEDTGSLTFVSTRPEDFTAAGWLLSRGADLATAAAFTRRALNSQQVEAMHELLGRLEFHYVNGVEIALVSARLKEYVGDLSVVVASLQEMENLNALFALVEMDGRLHLIARSRVTAVNAGGIAAIFGGGGHPSAASAVVRGILIDEARRLLMQTLEETIAPVPTAGDLMVSPVITIGKEAPIEEAEAMMTRYNFNALPVAENGKPAGIITRQTVEKALYHRLGKEKVSDYMHTDMAQVTADAPYDTVKEIIVRQKQKVVPVVDKEGILTGIIGRSDVLHAIYGDMLKHRMPGGAERKTHRPVGRDLTGVLRERLPKEILAMLADAGRCAGECGSTAYAVGGFVRDLLMRRKNLDVDLVIEGDGIEFARRFAARHNGKVRAHKSFKTAIITLPGHHKIDVATARTEYYTEPAALPIVEMSSIKNDLYRRDFTLNALAIALNGRNTSHLIDFFGGQQDLKDGVLRVLHNLSFVEDPTRIFRALRFEQRYGMTLGGQTEKLMKLAVRNGMPSRLSGARIFGELNLMFKEEYPSRPLLRMADFGLWRFIHPAPSLPERAEALLRQAEDAVAWHRLGGGGHALHLWRVFLHCAAEDLNDEETTAMLRRLGLMKEPVERFVAARRRVIETAARLERMPSPTPVDLHELLEGLDDEELLCVMARAKDHAAKRCVVEYMTRLRHVAAKVKGDELIAAGIQPGPLMGKVMDGIVHENLKGLLPTKEDELRFAKAYYEKLSKRG